MKKIIIIASLVICSKFSFGQSNISVNKNSPKITITDWIINTPKDKDLENKYIVLEFWATWCGPCINAVPHLNKIQEKFNQKNLYFISITDESIEKVNRIAKRIKFNSIVVSDQTKKTQIGFGNGKDDVAAYPMTVLIDNNGIIKWIGIPEELNEKIINEFLDNKLKPYNAFNINESDNIDTKGNDSNKSINDKETTEEGDYNSKFLKIVLNKDIKYLFDIQKTNNNDQSSISVNENMFFYSSISIKDIFKKILSYNFVLVNDSLNVQNYTIKYKNSNKTDKKIIEKEILDKLHLNKTVVKKEFEINKISILNEDLLEVTLNENGSSISHSDDKILITGLKIKDLINELNKMSTNNFELNNIQNEKLYDFVINVKSKKAILKSLRSYGFIIETTKELKDTYLINLKR